MRMALRTIFNATLGVALASFICTAAVAQGDPA
jgi:hypothetical protein